MKHADQNEMDVLLRSFARRNVGGTSIQTGAEAGFAEHMDADELNAFAEGMLPAQARARYSAHLADCANCRTIVIKLTQAAGFATDRQAVEEQSTAPFWDQLTAVFSQPFLRYAIPAFVLASILGVGLLALRQDGSGEFIAQHQPSGSQTNVDQPSQVTPSESPSHTETMPKTVQTPPGTASSASPTVDALKGESGTGIAGAAVPTGPPAMRREADVQPAEATPTFAPDLNAPAAPPQLPAYAARDRAQTFAKEEVAKREAEAKQVDEANVQTSDSKDDRDNSGLAAKSAASPSKPGNLSGLMRERRGSGGKDKEDPSGRADSRTISGKRFFRQNNSWVDSAYESSRATTNVKRGSEQYRALVADEPGIQTFAEHLSGEVIVVWKGRAYRIY